MKSQLGKVLADGNLRSYRIREDEPKKRRYSEVVSQLHQLTKGLQIPEDTYICSLICKGIDAKGI
jgi:hypothetical protein